MKEKRAPRMMPKFAWLMGMTAMTATIATIVQQMSTGTRPQKMIDFVVPKTDNQGNRMSMPTYWKDMFSLGTHPVKYIESST